jgi:hypothetical protein
VQQKQPFPSASADLKSVPFWANAAGGLQCLAHQLRRQVRRQGRHRLEAVPFLLDAAGGLQRLAH